MVHVVEGRGSCQAVVKTFSRAFTERSRIEWPKLDGNASLFNDHP